MSACERAIHRWQLSIKNYPSFTEAAAPKINKNKKNLLRGPRAFGLAPSGVLAPKQRPGKNKSSYRYPRKQGEKKSKNRVPLVGRQELAGRSVLEIGLSLEGLNPKGG